jgi:NmrA-like family
VDYSSHSSLVDALRDVHTLISVIKIPGPEWASYQLVLLSAAESAGVRRFAPSEFEQGPLGDGTVDAVAPKLAVRDACRDARGRGVLETARFHCGGFMNILALGLEDGKRTMLKHGYADDPIIWNVKDMTAEVPVKENGSTPRMTLTKIGDIGRFVAAACELEDGKWEEDMGMVGETIAISDVVRLIEEVRGRKMDVKKRQRRSWSEGL